ncbi:hypothetical protein TNIN_148261 [Trichonephila inaurata madagascariensis]|uniref:Uncharacterized protein n=1 Tax=Trichonephila inaurata madagascariensis TaxID=2747483 RepID=A0A8X6WQS5_9ARAC|nr:hypothetical protein TNIN_148261 [Trichonephila inaurata madagascariensis]
MRTNSAQFRYSHCSHYPGGFISLSDIARVMRHLNDLLSCSVSPQRKGHYIRHLQSLGTCFPTEGLSPFQDIQG